MRSSVFSLVVAAALVTGCFEDSEPVAPSESTGSVEDTDEETGASPRPEPISTTSTPGADDSPGDDDGDGGTDGGQTPDSDPGTSTSGSAPEAEECRSDADCPALPCSTSRCEQGVCVESPLVCDDDNVCTADGCDMSSGQCTHTFIDVDADGYGPDPACGGDCNDNLAMVHPAQEEWFTQPIPGTSSFDYNCDGVEQQLYPEFGSTSACVACDATQSPFGWVGGDPTCGNVGTYLDQCIPESSGQCSPIYVEAIQPCR